MLSEKIDKEMNEVIDNCMGDAPPACVATCPLHIDAKGYIELINDGEYKEALELIRETTPFPGILGRICAHPCEEECKRQDVESALSIKNLKRFAAEYDDPADWDLSIETEKDSKVAIIGAGPAGALAAYDLRKKGHQVIIYEKLPVVGGMLRVGIPAYRLPHDVIDEEYSILEKLGIEINLNTEIGTDISFDELEKNYDAIFVAIGAHESIMLPIEGSDLEGVKPGVDILRKAGLEEHSEIDVTEKVTVIGGGNVAMDVARTVWRSGAKEVNIACLESREEMPAHEWEVEDAEEEGIKVHCGWGPLKINGEDKVEGITLKKCTRVFDEDDNFNPEYDVCQTKDLEAGTVIFAIGQSADSKFLEEDQKIKINRGGKVDSDAVTLQTAKEHVFAGGDTAGRPLLAIEAMAHGRKAAISIDRYLKGEDLTSDRELEGSYETWLDKEVDEPELERIKIDMISVAERKGNFKEIEIPFTEQRAQKEAERCLQCECKDCMDECVMLNDFCEFPKELFIDILEEQDVDPVIPYSCNMCSQCTIACPQDYKFKDIFMKIRKKMIKENNGKSPIKGHNAIEWHQRLGFSWLFNTAMPAKEGKKDE